MKYFLLHAFVCMLLTANAQFKISNDRSIKPSPNETKFNSVVIDKSFGGKVVEIWNSDKNQILSLKDAKLDTEISKNEDGDYSITIDANGKIKECEGEPNCMNVKNSFQIKLDGQFYGPFQLSQTSNIVTTPPAAALNRIHSPGNIINDVFFINDNFPAGSRTDEIKYTLKYYGIENADSLEKNKFLNSVLNGIYSKAQIQGGGISLATFASSIGGLDVTKIADGFAKFIVERTKQELSITFFNTFKTELKKYPDLKTLFPSTVSVMEAIDKDIYNYSNYLNSLREAFRADILVLDENLPGIIDNHEDFFNTGDNYKYAMGLRSGCYISTSVRKQMHPGDILENYPLAFLQKPDGTDYTDLKTSIQSLQLLSRSLKDTAAGQYWVPIDKIREVVSNKNLFKIYLGLVYQVAKNDYEGIKFSTGTTFLQYLDMLNVDQSYDDYTLIKQYVLTFGSKINELNSIIDEHEKPANDSLRVEQYARYFKATAEFVEYCTRVGELPYINKTPLAHLHDSLEIYFEVAYQTVDLATSINRKNYTAAITEAVAIYNTIVNRPVFAYASLNSNDEARKTLAKTTDETYQKLLRFGAFMASIVEAKNSDEVAKAIEAAAMPAGSARVKRESRFNVS
ncbi:MAG TPA: hypothetical protein VEC12_00835, partial [Bacteroidia bacterium]|nr:hypothetical protein [Bacteroidia bacterium]